MLMKYGPLVNAIQSHRGL